MKHIGWLLLCALVALPACANKGRLLSPSQIAHRDEKKARKEAAQEEKDAKDNAQQEPSDSPAPNAQEQEPTAQKTK